MNAIENMVKKNRVAIVYFTLTSIYLKILVTLLCVKIFCYFTKFNKFMLLFSLLAS